MNEYGKRKFLKKGRSIWGIILSIAMVVTSLYLAPQKVQAAQYGWVTLGENVSSGSVGCPQVVTDEAGNIYAAYMDKYNQSGATVKKYDKGNKKWVTLGKENLSEGKVSDCQLQVDAKDGSLYIAYKIGSTIYVRKYNTSKKTWDTYGDTAKTNNSYVYKLSMTVYNSIVYVAYYTSDSHTVRVVRYKKDTTTNIITTTALTDIGSATCNAAYYTIGCNKNGYLYCVYELTSPGKLYVKRYKNNQWSDFGSFSKSIDGIYPTIKFGLGGNPYVAYCEAGKNLQLIMCDGPDGTWKTVGGIIETGKASYPQLVMDRNYNPIVFYSAGLKQQYVKKYNRTSLKWELLGSKTGFDSDSFSLAIDNNDMLLMGYADNNKASKMYVKAYMPIASVESVTTSASARTYKAWNSISIMVNFSGSVAVTGTPTLTLETGTTDRTASYKSGSGTKQLTFTYTVKSGDNSADLDYVNSTSLALNGGTITDMANGSDADLTLPTPGAKGSLGYNGAAVIDALAPESGSIKIKDGKTKTNKKEVTLTLYAKGASEMMISEASNFSGASYETYQTTKEVTLSDGDGDKTIYVKYKDEAGNETDGSLSASITLDQKGPVPTIESSLKSPTREKSIPVTIKFSEDVTDFIKEDIQVDNGSVSSFTQEDASTYQAKVVPIKDGDVSITIITGAAIDVVGNESCAADVFHIVSDTKYPNLDNGAAESDGYTAYKFTDVSLDEVGTFYYILVSAKGAKEPTIDQLKAGEDYEGGVIVAKRSVKYEEALQVRNICFENLDAGSSYKVYCMTEDLAENHSPIYKYEFSTLTYDIAGLSSIAAVDAGTEGSATYKDAKGVIAALPDKVIASTLTPAGSADSKKGEDVSLQIASWADTDGYKADKAGSYTFTATITLPNGCHNPSNSQATVEVVVAKKSYSIIYHANGGSGTPPIDTKAYYSDDTISLKDKGSMYFIHHTFQGWSLKADGTPLDKTEIKVVDSNLTLYAIWSEDTKHMVTYDLNGGEGTAPVDQGIYYKGDKVSVASGEGLSMSHHTFGGWAVTKDGGNVGSSYTFPDSDTVFYAIWIEDGKYMVSYDANGGSGNVPVDSKKYYAGEYAVLLDGSALIKEKHYLMGWSFSKEPKVVSGASIIIPANNVTLYAVWTENPKSQQKEITSFNLSDFTPGIAGTVNETEKTISLMVPYGTDVTKLAPTILQTGISVSPTSGVAQDFTKPVSYTVTAEDGTSQNYTVTVTVKEYEGPSPSSSNGNAENAETITVEVKEGESDSTASKIIVHRETTASGEKNDKIVYEKEKAMETINKLKEAHETVARIFIPDNKDEVSKTDIVVPTSVVSLMVENDIDLKIETENASIVVQKETLQSVKDGLKEDLYFNLVPVKREEEKNTIVSQTKIELEALNHVDRDNVSVIGRPVEIETNMPSSNVDIILPLTGIDLPENANEREELLNKIGVFIEHSDGEKEYTKGEIVLYKEGVYGIKFTINKFSMFTIVKVEDEKAIKSSNCKVTKVIVPKQSTLKQTTIESVVSNQAESIALKLNVSEKATWKLYKDKACQHEISSKNLGLTVGSNQFYIKVVAEDKTSKIYKMKIKRRERKEKVLFITTKYDVSDSVASSVLAAQYGGEIIRTGITTSDAAKTIRYIKKNYKTTARVYIIGLGKAVNKDLERLLNEEGYQNIINIGGGDKYETAAKIAKKVKLPIHTKVVLINGQQNPQDIQAIQKISAKNTYPILYITQNDLTDATRNALKRINPEEVYVIGNKSEASDLVISEIKALLNISDDKIKRTNKGIKIN